jgi:ATPase family protein associated with various cellular activities (AAA)/winged helix domain-containing protein
LNERTTIASWSDANQRYLMAAVGVVRDAIERHIARTSERRDQAPKIDQPPRESEASQAPKPVADAMPSPPALDVICQMFGLTTFERHLLVLCAAVELDSTFAALCATAQGDPARAFPTFSLALAALPDAHWSAVSPTASLRRWHLIEVTRGPLLTQSALRIDERILNYLAGVQHVDERLAGLVESVPQSGELVPSHQTLVQRIGASWSRMSGEPARPIIQLCGQEVADKRAIAAGACAAVRLRLAAISVHAVPGGASDLEGFARLWGREAALSNCALMLECHELDPGDSARASSVNRLIETLNSPLIVSSVERWRMDHRPVLTFDVLKPTPLEQRGLWDEALKDTPFQLNGQAEAMVAQFNLSVQKVYAARADATGSVPRNDGRIAADGATALWDACRMQARPRLDSLAQRIEPAASWDDLILPPQQLRILHDVALHVRHRTMVYEKWGFAAKGARGLGISALFSGVSGTGKTMAAEVLANELRLDLYRIDLSAVVSKYIGETEKNLRRVFDAAEEGGAILLFDEADALFGKRSEVKDSHDRYANIEVSYLLQRMETYRGLAILTTNLKSALDTAFLRRIRFIVQFPFPDAAQRAEIWRRIFPRETPTEHLDQNKLARLNVAGGNIRNIALNAAFLAADAREPVRMTHLLRAAQSEYIKLEKSLTEAEVKGWA